MTSRPPRVMQAVDAAERATASKRRYRNEMVDWARIGFIVIWLIPAFVLFPSMMRCWRNCHVGRDRVRSAFWYVALVMIGFGLRWILFPHAGVLPDDEAMVWTCLYLLGAVAGINALAAVWLDDAG